MIVQTTSVTPGPDAGVDWVTTPSMAGQPLDPLASGGNGTNVSTVECQSEDCYWTGKRILILTAGVGTVAANVASFLLLIRCRQLPLRTRMSVISLSVSDFFVGLIAIVTRLQPPPPPDLSYSCVILYTPALAALYSTMFTLLVMTVDRWVAVMFPLKHKILVTKWCLGACLLTAWILAGVLSSFSFFTGYPGGEKCMLIVMTGRAGLWVWAVASVAIFCTILLFYVAIIWRLQHRIRRVAPRVALDITSGELADGLRLNSAKRDRYNTNTIAVLVVPAALGYLPIAGVAFWINVTGSALADLGRDPMYSIFTLGSVCLVLNSLINPLIYVWRLREIRTTWPCCRP